MSAIRSFNPPHPSSSPNIHLQSFLSHRSSAKTAAVALAAPTSTTSSSSSPCQTLEDAQYHVWNLILDTAAQNPGYHADLVSLLEAFIALEDEDEEELRLWGGKDLGRFAQVWRGEWEYFHGQRHSPTPHTPSPSTLYTTFTTFSAHLAHHRICDIDLVFGFFTIRDILESPLPFPLPSGSITHQIITDLHAAAQWILIAGEDIYKADNKDVSELWKRGMGMETPLWKGDGGWSRERWRFWRERFEVLGEELGGEVVERVVGEVVGRMEGIERGV